MKKNIKVRQHFRLGSTGMDLCKVWFFWTKIKRCNDEGPGLTTQQEINLKEQDQIQRMRMFFYLEWKGMLWRWGENRQWVWEHLKKSFEGPLENSYHHLLWKFNQDWCSRKKYWINLVKCIGIPLACSRDGLDLLFWHCNYLVADLSSTLYKIWLFTDQT